MNIHDHSISHNDDSNAGVGEHHQGIFHGFDLSKVNISALPKAQREHLLMHEKHYGHEHMHAMMLLILLGSMFIAQVLLIWWRKKSFKTYQNVSMFGMWIIPFALSCYNHYWRFVFIWVLITALTLSLIIRPLWHKNLDLAGSSLPRLVYRWFFYLYSISSMIAVTGYVIVMGTLVGVNVLLGIKPMYTLDFGILMLFYGIYYGVLTRDFTDFLVDRLAANIGYYQPSSGLPSKQLNSRTCAICGRPHRGSQNKDDDTNVEDDQQIRLLSATEYYKDNVDLPAVSANDPALNEKTYTLTCGHTYHQFCIFGWCLVGKKQVCPFCREKVDLNKLFASLPFQKPHYLYGNLLDFIRYLIAWQPLILFLVQAVNHYFGLE